MTAATLPEYQVRIVFTHFLAGTEMIGKNWNERFHYQQYQEKIEYQHHMK